MTPSKAQAIQTALTGDWNSAILLNQTILEEDPNDIDTLNRLAFAFSSLGNIKEAKNVYQRVLELDVQNPIALRNLKRLSSANQVTHNGFASTQMANLFIEEPGKTKVIDLINIAEKQVISPLRAGELLHLSIKRSKIFIHDSKKQYIGMLPDDIGNRIIKFMESGNEYEAYVKSIDNNKVTIFVRETKRSDKNKHQPSFVLMDKSKLSFETNHFTKHQKQTKHENDIEDHSSDEGDEEESL